MRSSEAARSRGRRCARTCKAIGGKARPQIVKDYLGWPLISAGAFALAQLALARPARAAERSRGSAGGCARSRASARVGADRGRRSTRSLPGVESTYLRTLAADALANIIRNVWAHAIIFCGHFPDQTYTFTQEEVENETRGGWYVRQLLGAANIEGSPLFHVISGNLGYQVEHHLYPDMPSSRYSEIAPKVKDICERYELPYNSGPFGKQWYTVHRTIFRLAFPGGKPGRSPVPTAASSTARAATVPARAAGSASGCPPNIRPPVPSTTRRRRGGTAAARQGLTLGADPRM